MARLLVPDGRVWVFQKLLMYWDFTTKLSLENSPKKRIFPEKKKSNSLGENAMLMTEVRGERPNRFRQKATASQLTTYHDQRYEVWWILTYAATFRWSGISIMDPSINSSDCWWFNGVQDIFLAHFRPTSTS